MTHEATLSFSYDRPSLAATVERSLRPETGDIQGDRSSTAVERDGRTLRVRLVADDPRALRAAKATWFGLVLAAEGVLDASDRVDRTGPTDHSGGDDSTELSGGDDSTELSGGDDSTELSGGDDSTELSGGDDSIGSTE